MIQASARIFRCPLLGLLVAIDHRARRFGCREIKVSSTPIFFNTVYRFITVTSAFFNILINRYIVCE